MKTPRSGEAAAALISVWIGLAALVASHLWSVADPAAADQALLKLGSWMPGWQGIGPYAGKETAGLIAWLASWVILFFLLRGLELNLKWWLYGFVAGIFLLAFFIFPPVYHAVFGWRY